MDRQLQRTGWALFIVAVVAAGCGPGPNDKPDAGPGDAGFDAGTDAGIDAGTDAGTPDLEVAVVRLNADGSRDDSFGTSGTAWVDLGQGSGNVWSMDVDAQNRLVLFGSNVAEGRDDIDRVVVRLQANGALDTAFAADGIHRLDRPDLTDQARHGFVQADGKIVASGYTPVPTGVGDQRANAVVLLRLNDDGTVDSSFGDNGVVESNPFPSANPTVDQWGMAEAYAVGRQSSGAYVTTGYGRVAASGPVDLVSFRFGADGAFDDTWGAGGTFLHDVMGEHDRGRNMVVLPDDRVFMVGSATTSADVDAMALMLTPEGALDTSFGTGGQALRSFDRKDEAFFGVAASDDGMAVGAVGYRGASDTEDMDAVFMIQPLTAGASPIFGVAPISETADDRLQAVTFDSAGKLVAVGLIKEGGEAQTLIVRMNADGTLDTSFGTGGVVKIDIGQGGEGETARAVVIQSDGKIVVAGLAEAP